jgi:hypothetical protein
MRALFFFGQLSARIFCIRLCVHVTSERRPQTVAFQKLHRGGHYEDAVERGAVEVADALHLTIVSA